MTMKPMPPIIEEELIRAVRTLSVDFGIANPPPPAGAAILQDDLKNWSTNIHKNRIVKIVSGMGVGQHRVILSNTDKVLTLNQVWTTPLDRTSTYMIYDQELYSLAEKLVESLGGIFINPYTGVGNINPAVVRSTLASRFKLAKIHIHWSVATSNSVTIALDSNRGAAYDTVLRLVPLGANTDLTVYFPSSTLFEPGDVITVAWTDDTGGAATWGVEIGTVPC